MRPNRLNLIKAAMDANAAQEEGAAPRPASVKNPNALGQYQAAVDAALSAMTGMEDLNDRAVYKRDVALPQVMPFVDEYVAAGHNYPNSVAVRAMIWLFDVGDIERGLNLGLHLMSQGVHVMPPRFNSSMQTFLCDNVYDWANEQLKADQGAAPYLDQLLSAMDAGKWDLAPPVASKVFAMAAKHAFRVDDYPRTVALCAAAKQVNPDGHGVKILLEKAQAKLAGGDGGVAPAQET